MTIRTQLVRRWSPLMEEGVHGTYFPELDGSTLPTSVYNAADKTTYYQDSPGTDSYTSSNEWWVNRSAESPLAINQKEYIPYSDAWRQRSTTIFASPVANASSTGQSRADSINSVFAKALSWDGPFLNNKVDMGGNWTVRSREEKASGYQDLWGSDYNAYVSGSISGSQLFNRALSHEIQYDSDRMMTDRYDFTSGLNAYSRARITFGSGVRLSFSGSFGGGSFSF